MKKMILSMVCVAMVGMLGACGRQDTISPAPADYEKVGGQDDSQQIANPWTEYASLEEAQKAAGITVQVPEQINQLEQSAWQACGTELLEVDYQDADGNRIYVRKAPGTDDISGDYNEYAETTAVIVNDIAVTMKGADGMVQLAVWPVDGNSYAVGGCNLTMDAMIDVVGQIQ